MAITYYTTKRRGIVATEAVAEACNAIASTLSGFDDREDIIRGIIGGD
jgi:hypothetical protein